VAEGGYHFYSVLASGQIEKAYEYYVDAKGQEIVTLLPEIRNKHWFKDFKFETFEDSCEIIDECAFRKIEERFLLSILRE